jgi:hypothetical protein
MEIMSFKGLGWYGLLTPDELHTLSCS